MGQNILLEVDFEACNHVVKLVALWLCSKEGTDAYRLTICQVFSVKGFVCYDLSQWVVQV